LRLERCRRDLLDPRLADRSIASIAFGWGFGDLSGFNRAFRAAFGATPREVRGQQGEPALG
jgi:AraC-like DNA-binding protein